MTTHDIIRLNLAQAMCLRPRMYTQNGTVAEICTLMIDNDGPQPIGGRRDNASVIATVKWLRANFTNDCDIAAELLAKYGTDADALDAICSFASTLQPE